MLNEKNFYSNAQTTTSNMIISSAPLTEKIDSFRKHDTKLKNSNTKLEAILNSIQSDILVNDDQYESEIKQNQFVSSSLSCSPFLTTSSSPFTYRQSSLPNSDETSIKKLRFDNINESDSMSSTKEMISDSSMNDHLNQLNHYQYGVIHNNAFEQNHYNHNQYVDHQMTCINDVNIPMNDTNCSYSSLVTTTNTYSSYPQYQTTLAPTSSYSDQFSNQNIDNYYNQNCYILNQRNNNSTYLNEQYSQQFYNHAQINDNLSSQLSYSNEANSLIFTLESNNVYGDLESSNITDSFSDGTSENESNDDLSLSYNMEANNFRLINQPHIELNDSKKLKSSNRKPYQKRSKNDSNSDQKLLISSVVTTTNNSSNTMTNNANPNKRKRKRILNRLQRSEATQREKRRMLKLNKAFEELRKVLPISEFAKNKLSRAETLKSAIEYIEKMSEILSL